MKKLKDFITSTAAIVGAAIFLFSTISGIAIDQWQRRKKLEKFAEVISGVVISSAEEVFPDKWRTKDTKKDIIVIFTRSGNTYGFSFEGKIPEVYTTLPDYAMKRPMMFTYKGDKIMLEEKE